MVALTLQNSNHKILIVGAIYDKIEKIQNAINLKDDYDFIIFNGNICYPNDDLDKVRARIDIISDHLSSGRVIYNIGQYDLQLMSKLKDGDTLKDWIKDKPNIVLINFKNQSSMIVVGGGIAPHMTKTDLYDNIELSFVSYIQGKPWHQLYGGGLGYVVSNNPLTQQDPKFYNYSAQIGNIYSADAKVYAQEANQFGLKRTILL